MAKYIDVVAVRLEEDNRPILYQAPWYSGLKKGMDVLTDDEIIAEVVCTMTCAIDSDELALVLALECTDELPKLKAVLNRSDYAYDDAEV